jgi:hypothetical protein
MGGVPYCENDADGQIGDLPVKPLAQKYSASVFAQITFLSAAVPSHSEGRFAIVTNAGRDAVDAEALLTNGA